MNIDRPVLAAFGGGTPPARALDVITRYHAALSVVAPVMPGVRVVERVPSQRIIGEAICGGRRATTVRMRT